MPPGPEPPSRDRNPRPNAVSGILRAGQLGLSTEAQYVRGVGPRLAQLLASRGVFTVEDLVSLVPFRYEDRTRQRPIAQLVAGESVTLVAQVRTLAFPRSRGGVTRLEMSVGDGSGTLHCVWYNAEYLRDRFESGQTLALYGKPAVNPRHRRLELQQPEFEILGPGGDFGGAPPSLKLGRIVPVYEAIGALTSARLRRLIDSALRSLPAELPDPLPLALRQKWKLPSRRAAFEQVHFPDASTSMADLEAARTPGHVRLILEELFCLQAGLELKRRRVQREPGPMLATNPAIRERLKQLLPFHPTEDQKNALRDIVADFRSGRPMRRLLQGDVGSGKTIVALEAAVIAMENGYQAALMAPTQILAEQHFLSARERLPGYRIALVTAATRRHGESRAREDAQLVIGTQALLSASASAAGSRDAYPFSRLGLVIVDEQHRFGVLQRFHLMHKGDAPAHVLVMTATPIPRTLALTLYGDLDASLIRHSPPGGLPIATHLLPEARSGEVYEFVRQRVAAGRQAYFVYPIIDESETLDLKPALRMFERLRELYPEFRTGLLHGRLGADEKQKTMSGFRSGAIQILVSTTVIEVGVDVPNATIMVIEHPERFGIAQLHQLRGRVGRPLPGRDPASAPGIAARAGRENNASANPGRGSRERPPAAARPERAHCFLLHGEPLGEAARQRLTALARTRDGFELAETDLKLRGAGEFFGTRQSGAPAFQIAQPLRDQPLLELARTEARAYLDRAPAEEQRRLIQHIQHRWQRQYGLIEVG